jgi:hypothetical protein
MGTGSKEDTNKRIRMPDGTARYWDFRRRKGFMLLRSEEKAAFSRGEEDVAIMGGGPLPC